MKRIVKIVAVNALLAFLLSEIALRILWVNPYVPPIKDADIHHAGLHLRFHGISELYEGAADPVYFNTSGMGYVESSRTKGFESGHPPVFAVAVGGSTTESAIVQEDRRWPDLLDVPTLNYGKSRMYSYNSHRNIVYLLNKKGLRPRLIFVMDGINNLSRFLSKGPSAFDLTGKDHYLDDPLIDFVTQNVYTASFLWKVPRQKNMGRFYRFLVKRNQTAAPIGDAALEEWMKGNEEAIHRTLVKTYEAMQYEAAKHGARIVVLTQPHAYRDDYKPYRGVDLRVFPIVLEKRLDVRQSRLLVSFFNGITAKVASAIGAPVIDVADCFDWEDVSPLIYDAWHFSEKGSAFFAGCLNRGLRENPL